MKGLVPPLSNSSNAVLANAQERGFAILRNCEPPRTSYRGRTYLLSQRMLCYLSPLKAVCGEARIFQAAVAHQIVFNK